ncbi:hypothetical protein ACFLZQ_07375 [Thermodesulfobacteriota bacterium]
MLGIKSIIDNLKSLVKNKPKIKPELIPFEYSADIDDSDEKDMELVADVYPSKADIPLDKSRNRSALETWKANCNVLISGISIPIGMDYTDAKGALTQRQVEVKKIIRKEDEYRYISGLCFLREKHRNFREDRIENLIELETGEVYPAPHKFFDKYGIFNSEKMEELQVILHILSYLARADRKFVDGEKELISEVISQYCDSQHKPLVENYAFTHKVSKKDYLNEVSKLAYMDLNAVNFLIRKAEELIKVDGKITPKEKEFFDLLKGN